VYKKLSAEMAKIAAEEEANKIPDEVLALPEVKKAMKIIEDKIDKYNSKIKEQSE